MSDAELEAIRTRLAKHDDCWVSADDIRDCLGEAQHDRRILLARLDATEVRERALRDFLWRVWTRWPVDALPEKMLVEAEALLAEPTGGPQ